MMDNCIDPEDEVRKLQDLVRKLEKQNELLRSKADAIGSPNANGTLPLSEANTNVNTNGDIKSSGKIGEPKIKNSSKNLLDAVKVLDVNPEESDDDTWLYTSPIKIATPEQKSVSPYDWVRQDFEHPNRDMESAKTCLLAKLDEVSRANRNSLGPSLTLLQQPHISNSSTGDPLRGMEKLETSPRSQSPPPVQRRERRQSNEERMGLAKLEDVTDVQILARMQEESLRQATQISPANSPRRICVSPASSENTLNRSASRSSSVSSTEGKSEDGEEGGRSNVVRRRPSFERIRKAGEGSERKESHISPRGAPDGRNGDARVSTTSRIRGYEAEKPPGHRGSMPNLNRTFVVQPPPPAPTPCTPPQTPSSNDNQPQHPHQLQPLELGAELSRLKQPSSIPVNRSPSPRTLKQPSPTKLRGASPHRGSGIPVRASQVERSQIPRPRSVILPKSGIPSPASKSTVVSPRGSVKTRDDSWREGCY